MFTNRTMSDGTNNSHESEETSPSLSYPPQYVRPPHRTIPRSPLGVLGFLAHQYEKKRAFLRLLPSVVDAEPESYTQADETKLAAIAILKRHPELLFEQGMVTDHFGRKIKASPYRLLLGASDVWALKQVHEEIIAKIEDQEARTQAENQTQVEFQTQFPNCPWPFDPTMPEEVLYDERNRAQIRDVLAQLKIIAEKIIADPCTNGQATKNETTEAIADLRKIFVPKKGEIIETGLHFPSGMMKEILKAYYDQFDSWWSRGQFALFSREAIGEVEAALSKVNGQCVKKGLAFLNMEKGPDRRDGLFCRNPKGIPEDKAPLVGKLGRTMFVDPYDGHCWFLSSTPGSYDWYNKGGFIGTTCTGAVQRRQGEVMRRSEVGMENLWRTKAEALCELLCGSAKKNQHSAPTSITARCGAW